MLLLLEVLFSAGPFSGRIWDYVAICAHTDTHTLHVCLCISPSVYVENHEFKLIPPVLIQHLWVHSSFFSFHICNPFSHSERNLAPIGPKVFTCLINPLVCHQPPISAATSPLLTTPPPQPGGPPCSAHQRVFSLTYGKKAADLLSGVFSQGVHSAEVWCFLVRLPVSFPGFSPSRTTRTQISHKTSPSLSFPVSKILTGGC